MPASGPLRLTAAPDDHLTAAFPRPRTSGGARRTVFRELGIFALLQVLLTTTTTAVAWQQGTDVGRLDEASPWAQTALYLSAFWPAVSALVARRVVHGRFRWSGWGLRRAPWRGLALAWVSTLATVLAAGALLWGTGVAALDPGAGGSLPLLGLTVVVLPYVLLALGEELGWRGLVVVRLAEVVGPRTVVLVSGVAWSMCHWPMILLLGGTPAGVSPAFALATFTVTLTAFSAVLTVLRLRWGIWPVCVAHAVWNATLYQVVEPVTGDGPLVGWFGTETGAFLAVTSVVAAALWWSRRAPAA